MQRRQEAYEARLRASRDELEQRVQARASELAGAEPAAQALRAQLADATRIALGLLYVAVLTAGATARLAGGP